MVVVSWMVQPLNTFYQSDLFYPSKYKYQFSMHKKNEKMISINFYFRIFFNCFVKASICLGKVKVIDPPLLDP